MFRRGEFVLLIHGLPRDVVYNLALELVEGVAVAGHLVLGEGDQDGNGLLHLGPVVDSAARQDDRCS